MSRPLDTRLDRVEGRRMAAAAEPGSAAIRPGLHAEAAMGAVIRRALAHAGLDAAGATRLSFADEAAAPLVTTPDTAELQREDGLLVLPALYERCSGKRDAASGVRPTGHVGARFRPC